MTVCRYCGAENRDTARFCINCASPLQSVSLEGICPQCGAQNLPYARYCHQCAAPLQAEASRSTGTLLPHTLLIGRYLILERVGQGGMGAVYRAADTRMNNKLWAIKELSDAAVTDPADRLRAAQAFAQEAQMLSRLSHQNLPRVVDHFSERGRQYLVMDFVAGETLEHKVTRRGAQPFSEAEVLPWAKQLCDVLSYLHDQQPPIIFRDLKPGNIMIGTQNQVQLIDFGIARLFKPWKATDTTSFGTAGYAPPEQYGKGQTDARSDLYALGATMHQLLTGNDPALKPFQFDRVRQLNPAVSQEVEHVVMRAVEQDPARRWPNARAMLQALQGTHHPKPVVSSSTAPARSVAYHAPASPVVKPQVAPRAGALPTGQRKKTKGWAWLLGVVALLVLAGSMLQAPGNRASTPGEMTDTAAIPALATSMKQRQSTSTAQAQSTATARVRSAATAQARGTATVRARTTSTARAEAVATAEARASATRMEQMQSTTTARAQSTATAQAWSEATARAWETATVRARTTSTARAEALATTRARGTATARAQARATTQSVEATATTAAQQGKRMKWPMQGSLAHHDDDYIEVYSADVRLRDVMVEATFFNPYDPSTGSWDHGFLFRSNEHGFYAIVITSSSRWYYYSVTDGNWEHIADSYENNIETGAKESNLLRLIATRESGMFFVNDEFVTKLDLSGRRELGDIIVTAGIFTGDEINGKSTRFENFTVWSLH